MTTTRTSGVILLAALVVSLAGAAGAGVGVASEGDSTACTCTSVDLQSGSVDLVVLADETGGSGASVSQQVIQNGDQARVSIDLEYDSTSVEIAGETVANGSLVLTVTQDGDVVNDSVVVNASESESVVFHVEPDDVRITREDEPCEQICEDDVSVIDGHPVDDGDGPSVEVNVGDGVDVNVDAGGPDSAKSDECKNASAEDARAGATDSSSATAIGVNELKLVSQPNDLGELMRRAGDCHVPAGEPISEPAIGAESD